MCERLVSPPSPKVFVYPTDYYFQGAGRRHASARPSVAAMTSWAYLHGGTPMAAIRASAAVARFRASHAFVPSKGAFAARASAPPSTCSGDQTSEKRRRDGASEKPKDSTASRVTNTPNSDLPPICDQRFMLARTSSVSNYIPNRRRQSLSPNLLPELQLSQSPFVCSCQVAEDVLNGRNRRAECNVAGTADNTRQSFFMQRTTFSPSTHSSPFAAQQPQRCAWRADSDPRLFEGSDHFDPKVDMRRSHQITGAFQARNGTL